MHGPFVQQRGNNEQEIEKTPFLVVQKIRDAILDETFKPGERLPGAGLGEMFKVSRSPVREALFTLESEGTVIMEPYRGGYSQASLTRGSLGYRRTSTGPDFFGSEASISPSFPS
jgi:DNA-binding FadR family transcriptional regulator